MHLISDRYFYYRRQEFGHLCAVIDWTRLAQCGYRLTEIEQVRNAVYSRLLRTGAQSCCVRDDEVVSGTYLSQVVKEQDRFKAYFVGKAGKFSDIMAVFEESSSDDTSKSLNNGKKLVVIASMDYIYPSDVVLAELDGDIPWGHEMDQLEAKRGRIRVGNTRGSFEIEALVKRRDILDQQAISIEFSVNRS